MTYFCPALDPPLDGSGRKTTTLVRDLEYFIHTKFHQNPSSGSGDEVENVNSLTDDGRQTDGRTTDAGQRVITIGHWSLWLLCPKNRHFSGTLELEKNWQQRAAFVTKTLIFGILSPKSTGICVSFFFFNLCMCMATFSMCTCTCILHNEFWINRQMDKVITCVLLVSHPVTQKKW